MTKLRGKYSDYFRNNEIPAQKICFLQKIKCHFVMAWFLQENFIRC